jgi:SHS2 domain-containing protein
MKKFRIIETTGDVGVVAFGDSLKEVFANTASGLFSVAANLSCIRKKMSLSFDAEGESLDALLLSWLNELIYIQEVNDFLGKEVDIKELSDKKISGELWGEKLDREKHLFGTEVKAATYHNLEIKTENGSWQITVIFDI